MVKAAAAMFPAAMLELLAVGGGGRPTTAIPIAVGTGMSIGAVGSTEVATGLMEEDRDDEAESANGFFVNTGRVGVLVVVLDGVVLAELDGLTELEGAVLDTDAILDLREEGRELEPPDWLAGMAAPSAIDAARAAKDRSEMEPERMLRCPGRAGP